MSIEYLKTYRIEAKMEVMSGLRVGAGKDSVEIGGIDSPIVKHPHSLQPYIPGSSLKGKLRSILEWALQCIEDNGDVWGTRTVRPGDVILRTFGTTAKNWKEGPTRLIVRDAQLCAEWRGKVTQQGLPLTEAKSEVSINRLQGKAASMGPRIMERVPAGALFDVDLLFKRYSVEDDNLDLACVNRVIEAMRLLEEDALGGSGSRGYGRVQFKTVRIDGEDITAAFRSPWKFDKAAPQRFVKE